MDENQNILPESEPLNPDLVKQIAHKILNSERSSMSAEENTNKTISNLLQILVDSVRNEANLKVR